MAQVEKKAEQASAPAIIKTTKRRVSCNGGGGALGHPAIYLNLGTDNAVTCPYCSARFEWVEK